MLQTRTTAPFVPAPGQVHARFTRQCVRVRAESDESKVVREYRESDDTFVTPKKKPNALFADEVKTKPQDNMSPEMKARLKQEYLGLGGSANTAMGSNYFLWIIVGVSVLAVASWLTGAI